MNKDKTIESSRMKYFIKSKRVIKYLGDEITYKKGGNYRPFSFIKTNRT